MAVSILDLAAGQKDLAIPVGSDAIKVRYQPEFYTLALEASMAEARQSEAKMAGFVDMFLDIVKVWDLEDGKGNVIPLSFDGFKDAGLTINNLNFIVTAIMKDVNEGETTSPS